MRTQTFTTVATTFAAALTLAVLFSSPSFAGTHRAELPEPVAIGDQVFGAGTVELVPMRKTQVVAIRIAGEQVAQVWLEPAGSGERGRGLQMRFQRDSSGLLHLVAVDRSTTARVRSEMQMLELASLAQGMMTVGNYRNRVDIASNK